MPRVDLELEIGQIAGILEGLSPGELETLEILLNRELTDEFKKRREEARIEKEFTRNCSATLCHPERSEGSQRFFATLRMTAR